MPPSSEPKCTFSKIGKNVVAKPPKRPRDFSQAAKLVIDVATGQVEDRAPTPEEQGKDPAAAALGRKGGAARAKAMTSKQRAEIARKAAKARWNKD
jgi:hypothetical protein